MSAIRAPLDFNASRFTFTPATSVRVGISDIDPRFGGFAASARQFPVSMTVIVTPRGLRSNILSQEMWYDRQLLRFGAHSTALMKVLGIETSCDETAVAVVKDGKHVLADFVYSQVEHTEFGGIVPEIASRQQLRKITPVFESCKKAYPISPSTIDAIAVTRGPGLIGSLMVGLNFAKALSYGWNIPLVGINHLEGHIFANLLADNSLKPPFITLIVSGGHTLLVKVDDWCSYTMLGSTRDDAAGEAFDKVAKLLGLGYPGGYKIDRLASVGDREFHRFPRSQFKKGEYQFSFSGLKTSVAVYLRDKSEEFKVST